MRSNRLLGVLATAGLGIFVSAGSAYGQVVVQLPGPPHIYVQPAPVYVAPPPPPVVYVAPRAVVYVEPPHGEVVFRGGYHRHGRGHGRGHR